MANLGEENPLPRFRLLQPNFLMRPPHNLSYEDKEALMTDLRVPVLPYTVLDGYDRNRKMRRLPTITLENNRLRAVFYPTLGGRITSLYDKKHKRELLHDNPVFQPCNLGLRNAWISGGIEWNGPVLGHTVYTVSPVFMGVVETKRGPMVRIYEFDRLFETTWQVDVFLPHDSDKLWVHVKVANPNPHPLDYYWWTNIGVPIPHKTRVLCDCDHVLSHTVTSTERIAFPYRDGVDRSYPENFNHADSIFFRKPGQKRPWEACLDKDGRGLMYSSTATLMGRKFWVWGNTPGGRHWMDYLALPGKGAYIELQGGITPTQFQTRPLKAKSTLEWTECLCYFELDAATAHHPDYKLACREAARAHFRDVPDSTQADIDRFMRAQADAPLSEVLSRGGPWGMLHEKRTGKRLRPGLDFTSEITEDAWPWAELHMTGTFSDKTLAKPPRSWCVSAGWTALLEASLQRHGATWLHHLHLGVARLEAGQFARAAEHFRTSLALKDNWHARRNLALLLERDGELAAARDAYLQAWKLSGDDKNLAVEVCAFFGRNKLNEDLESFFAALPAAVADHERIQLTVARVRLDKGDFAFVRRVLAREFITVGEGETVLSDVWFDLHFREAERKKGRPLTPREKDEIAARIPPSPTLDFRMYGSRCDEQATAAPG
jgi:tetratricopeptide (TPR) repeat protein